MRQLKTALNIQRRERMINAGWDLFLSVGFRGTSMGEVAKRAEVAKPTLYKYFADKETLFRAGVAQLIGEAEALCLGEFSKSGSVVSRIAGALVVKHKLFFRVVARSQYAEELYSQSARLTVKEIEIFENWLGAQIGNILKEGGVKSPNSQAQLLMACAYGIAKRAQHVEEIGPAIRLVTQKLLD